jgi:20S proteasome alpha/beta subunit
MFAGMDVSSAENVINKARHLLKGSAQPTSLEISQRMREAYQSTRRTRIEDTLLSSCRWDIDYFLKNGRRLLGQAEFSSRLYQVEQFDLGCSFLLCGFFPEDADAPLLFQVDNPGFVTPQTLTGYAAIGSGSTNSLAYLDWREQTWALSMEQSLYNCIAAKSLGESALGVGAGTTGLVLTRGNPDPRNLKRREIEAIKEIWSKEEAAIRPLNVRDRVSRILGG